MARALLGARYPGEMMSSPMRAASMSGAFADRAHEQGIGSSYFYMAKQAGVVSFARSVVPLEAQLETEDSVHPDVIDAELPPVGDEIRGDEVEDEEDLLNLDIQLEALLGRHALAGVESEP